MQNPTDLDPPNHVHPLTLIFAISGVFIENESNFFYLYNNNYLSSKTQLYREFTNIISHVLKSKDVSSYTGAGI